ncbi:MAG: hypothetical protein JXR46_10915 [Calditrichaceae bacterium]|nr:hypothetical protein [Calditrichaceae bacterium]
MCRLLAVQAKAPFEINDYLENFSVICKNSREFQGHGWGCSYLDNGKWIHYKNILPVWEDNIPDFGKSTLLLAHARSAFQNRNIIIENNMPFYDDKTVFIFNGELHRVKINAEGRIGAEKIFNFIKRFKNQGLLMALKKGTHIIESRSHYIRAMNIIISDKKKVFVSSLFNEDEDYFTMHYKKTSSKLIICSNPFENENGWNTIANRTIREFTYDDY